MVSLSITLAIHELRSQPRNEFIWKSISCCRSHCLKFSVCCFLVDWVMHIWTYISLHMVWYLLIYLYLGRLCVYVLYAPLCAFREYLTKCMMHSYHTIKWLCTAVESRWIVHLSIDWCEKLRNCFSQSLEDVTMLWPRVTFVCKTGWGL